jgi:hypothetical protein
LTPLRWIRCSAAAALLLAPLAASAAPVTFQLESFTNTATTYTLVNAPVVGSGDLAVDPSGNLVSGSLQLPAFQFVVDANGDGFNDFRFDTTPSSQTLAAALRVSGVIDLVGGSATGSSSCTVLPGAVAGSICPPPALIAPLGTDSAGVSAVVTMAFDSFNSPTDFAGTITGVTVRTAPNGSTTTQRSVSRFATVPEPSAIALLAAPLALAARGRRRRR